MNFFIFSNFFIFFIKRIYHKNKLKKSTENLVNPTKAKKKYLYLDKSHVETSEILDVMRSISGVTDEQIQQFNKFKLSEIKKICKNMKIKKEIKF